MSNDNTAYLERSIETKGRSKKSGFRPLNLTYPSAFNQNNQLRRLVKIMHKEEVLIIFYIDLELSQNKASDISLEELSNIVMGGRDKPTAVRLLFEMPGGNPSEPSRLEAGKKLFEKAKIKISRHRYEDINALNEVRLWALKALYKIKGQTIQMD